jgi:hypothetical protein
MGEQVVLVLLGAGVALISSLVTLLVQHRLSLRREYSLKWWEKKANAYTDIVEQLSRIEDAHVLILSRYHNAVVSGDANYLFKGGLTALDEIQESHKAAVAVLRRTVAAGNFMISDGAATALAHYVEMVSTHIMPALPRLLEDVKEDTSVLRPIVDHFAEELTWIRECIGQVRSCAKADLRVN